MFKERWKLKLKGVSQQYDADITDFRTLLIFSEHVHPYNKRQ